jgi:peptidyl-prolyl cis-trans isomerase SurA
MWDSPDVLKRRVPRVLATGILLAVAVSGLSACRTSPTVAAYVGDEQVTVAELQSAIDDRREDPDVDAFAEANPDDFSRRVLTLLVQEEVYTAAAQRYDVDVTDDDVRARIEVLLGEDDPDTVFGQLASQGVTRADVYENVRQQLIRQQIAIDEGKAEGLTDAGLRAAYEKMRTSATTVRLGYIAVPDQATADAVLAQLTAAPSRYAAVAAQYAGQYTLPEVEERTPDQIPGPLAQQAATAKPGTGFTVAVPEVGGVIVAFVGPYPSFEESRPQLEQQAGDAAAQAGTALVDDVRADLDVTVNPRFGVLKEGQLVPDGSGVVDLLEGDAAAAAEPAPAGN